MVVECNLMYDLCIHDLFILWRAVETSSLMYYFFARRVRIQRDVFIFISISNGHLMSLVMVGEWCRPMCFWRRYQILR